jgi:hypothetical protein
MNNIDIIIQGPLSIWSIQNISYYKTIGNVIVSHWEDDDELLKKMVDKYNICRIELSTKEFQENSYYNYNNIAKQHYTLINGINSAKNDIIIKTRSDEFYSDLSPLIEKFVNTNKIITNNIYFRRDLSRKFHMSDHLFIGKKQIFRSACNELLKKLKYVNKFYTANSISDLKLFKITDGKSSIEFCPEIMFTLSIIDQFNIKIDIQNSKKIMKNIFDIVPISKLGLCKWTCNSDKKHRSNCDIPDDSIDSMDSI